MTGTAESPASKNFIRWSFPCICSKHLWFCYDWRDMGALLLLLLLLPLLLLPLMLLRNLPIVELFSNK